MDYQKSKNYKALKNQQLKAKKSVLMEIESIQDTLIDMEKQLDRNNSEVHMTLGLLTNGSRIDTFMGEYVAYTRALELFKEEFILNEEMNGDQSL